MWQKKHFRQKIHSVRPKRVDSIHLYRLIYACINEVHNHWTLIVCMTSKRLIMSRKIDAFVINLSSTHQFPQIAISLLIFHPVSCGLSHCASNSISAVIVSMFCVHQSISINIMYLMVIFPFLNTVCMLAGFLPFTQCHIHLHWHSTAAMACRM